MPDDTKAKRFIVTVGDSELDGEPLKGQLTINGFEVVKLTGQATAAFTKALDSKEYRAIKRTLEKLAAEIQELKESYPEVQAIMPFLAVELEEAQREGRYPGVTLSDLVGNAFYSDGTPRSGEYLPLVERAREQLPHATAITSDKLSLPLDIINKWLWNRMSEEDPNISKRELDTASKADRKKGKDISIIFGLDFSALEDSGVTITRQLTPFDKWCYMAAAALYNAGNDVMSCTQVYKMMGYRGSPNAEHIQRINASISKMGAARVTIDTTKESTTYKGYEVFKYDSSLLPFERISAYINGQFTESAIHLFREPPLLSFARERKQIASIPRQLLDAPISKTDFSFRLEDYLLTHISHMKNDRRYSRKMTYATIFDKCHLSDKKQRQRAKGTIEKILTHDQQQGFIRGFTEAKDGVAITL